MNQIWLLNNEQTEHDCYRIEDSLRLEHFHQILRAKVGDTLKVFKLNGPKGVAQIVGLEAKQATLKLQAWSPETRSFPSISLMVGLSRPPTVKKILEHGTALGVTDFHFFKAHLSEKSYLQSKLLNEVQLQEQLLLLGLAQSNYFTQLPKVLVSPYLPSTESLNAAQQKFVLSFSDKARKLSDYQLRADQAICLALGPERGLTAPEEAAFIAAGYQPLSLSPSVLRTEIATFVALGQLHQALFA